MRCSSSSRSPTARQNTSKRSAPELSCSVTTMFRAGRAGLSSRPARAVIQRPSATSTRAVGGWLWIPPSTASSCAPTLYATAGIGGRRSAAGARAVGTPSCAGSGCAPCRPADSWVGVWVVAATFAFVVPRSAGAAGLPVRHLACGHSLASRPSGASSYRHAGSSQISSLSSTGSTSPTSSRSSGRVHERQPVKK